MLSNGDIIHIAVLSNPILFGAVFLLEFFLAVSVDPIECAAFRLILESIAVISVRFSDVLYRNVECARIGSFYTGLVTVKKIGIVIVFVLLVRKP